MNLLGEVENRNREHAPALQAILGDTERLGPKAIHEASGIFTEQFVERGCRSIGLYGNFPTVTANKSARTIVVNLRQDPVDSRVAGQTKITVECSQVSIELDRSQDTHSRCLLVTTALEGRVSVHFLTSEKSLEAGELCQNRFVMKPERCS